MCSAIWTLRLHEQHGVGHTDNILQLGDTDAVLLMLEIDEHEKLKHDVEIYELPDVEEEEARTSKHEELWWLLNDKKECGKAAIDMAMEMGRGNVAEILVDVTHLARNLQPVADVDLLNLSDYAKSKIHATHAAVGGVLRRARRGERRRGVGRIPAGANLMGGNLHLYYLGSTWTRWTRRCPRTRCRWRRNGRNLLNSDRRNRLCNAFHLFSEFFEISDLFVQGIVQGNRLNRAGGGAPRPIGI